MLIYSLCPKCETEHELSNKLLGEQIYCQKCGEPFKVEETKKDAEAMIGVQSVFHAHADEAPATHPDPNRRSKMRLVDGKHNLVLPPPPIELWRGRKSRDEDDPEGFREFRHDSRALEEFLEREQGADYSGLLIGGMVFTTVVVFGLIILIICLILFA